MEAKDIYITQALSTKDLLGQAGQCFYLPSYQRQYAWDALQVKQLCDDIFDGISRLYDNDKTFTFCGSVITVKDANASSVHPKVIQDQPTSVLLLIDGQQRLTTLMMIVMAVHEAIQNRIDLFKKDRVGAVPGVDDWLYANAKSACADLHNALVVTRPEEHGKKPLYPRMIRAGFDEWSPNEDTQKYESPIAFVVNEYMAHNVAHKNSGVATFYTPPTRPKTVFRGEKEFLIRFSEIKSMVQNQITGNTDDGDEFIPLSKTLYNQQILSELNISPGDAQKKEFSQIPLGDTDFAELLRTLVIARYLLTRVAITSIQCKDEEYAFEVFEALNTSGTPLTAFETFVPMVVSRIGEKVYATSQQKVEIDKINNFFDGFDAGAAREKKTKELVTHFANSETGEKLGSHISRQQLFFRRLLQGKQAIEVAEVVHNFYHVKNLVEGFDSGISPTVPMISAADGDFLNLAFSFFKALTHTIVIPPLAAFYSKAVDAQNKPATADYVAAVKASLAFTVLWRSCFSNTHGIDSRYRDLMKNNDDFFYRGLARDLKNPVDINLFKAELRRVLKDKGKIDKKVTFLEKSRLIEFYTVSKPLTRIVLLAAHDQSAVTASGGLIQGRPNLHPYLTVEQFNGKEMAAIEHIAPQTRSNNWSHEIYAAGYLHRIGNLTLTSQKLNSSFGARSWEEKKVLYDALSQQVPDDARQIFDAAFANGIAFGEQTEELMAEYKYTPILESLSKFTDWNKTSCEDRGINILERTWDYFWPFLN